MIIMSVVIYIILVDDLMGINIYALLLSVAALLVLGIVSIMTNVVIPITLYYPIFETKFGNRDILIKIAPQIRFA